MSDVGEVGEDGEVVGKRGGFVVEWKIEDFLEGLNERGKVWNSPTFHFSVPWYLCMELLEKDASVKPTAWLGLYLVMEDDYMDCKATMLFTLGLKAADGTFYKSMSDTHRFTASYMLGWSKAIEREELVRERSTLCPNGTITIYCEMRFKEDAEFQTLPYNEKRIEQEDKTVQVYYNKNKETLESDVCYPNDLDVLTTNLVGFFLNKKSCDVTILIGDHCFEAHRVILGIRSPIFAAKFKDTMEQKKVEYHVDCDPDAFYKFLLYLYSSKIEDISIDLVIKLYGIATEYEVSPLIKTCATYMINNTSVDAFCDIFLVAQTHGEIELLQALKTFFVTNMGSIIITETWLSFLNEHANLINDLLMHVSKHV